MSKELKTLTDEELKKVTGGGGADGTWGNEACRDYKSKETCEANANCNWEIRYSNGSSSSNVNPNFSGGSYHVCADKPVGKEEGGGVSGEW